MSTQHRITVAHGDGIGPEIMDATLRILQVADAPLEYDVIQIGEPVYLRGITSGIPDEAWDTIRRNKVLLKAPITTPLGGGYKSLNVAIRSALNLFANVRQSKSYSPFVASTHSGVNVVIIRENEEDVYAGIEHQQTAEVTQTLKLVTRPGTERIIRYAFEYARAYGRRKVACMTKDNIMKLTDGLFHRVFTEVAKEYPEIYSEHQIIDIGAARLAAQPERFDVIVTLNLYGDILSDIAAQIAGSVGLAGSANVGTDMAMFEAVHGSAPDIAGKGVANPSGLLVAAVQMLVHLGEPEVAQRVKNAWLCTLEDGIHTADIYREGLSRKQVGTAAFTDAVIAHLGSTPRQLEPVHYRPGGIRVRLSDTPRPEKRLAGIDVFLDWDEAGRDPEILGKQLTALDGNGLALRMITNRGVKVYPGGIPETFCTDHWRCRFAAVGDTLAFSQILDLLSRVNGAGLEVIKTEHLYTFDGVPGFLTGRGRVMTTQTWNPETYARNARFVSDLGMPVVELLAPQPGERILDLGCGDGALTAKLVALGCDVVGVDSSPEQVAAAVRLGLEARVMDGHALDFDGEFDAVFSNAALHWMRRPDDVIAGVARALRPGGRFVGECGGAGNIQAIVIALFAAMRRRGIDPESLNPWYYPGAEEYRSRLEAHGFLVRSIALFPRPTPQPGDISGWLETFAGAFLSAVPEDARPSFIAEVREALRPTLLNADGTWVVDYVRLRFAAHKPGGADAHP